MIQNNSIIIKSISKKEYLETHIKVLVWNIYKSKKVNFFDTFYELYIQSDLMLLQEYLSSDKYDFEKINEDFVVGVSFHNSKDIPTGVCTIAKAKHVKAICIKSTVREPFLNTPKVLLETKYKISNGGTLTVINVHCINFVSIEKFISHMDQIALRLKEIDGPILLAGDFNTWNKDRIKYLNMIAKNYGFEEVIFQNDLRKIKLDRVLVKNIKVLNSSILNDINTSDHKPMYLELLL